ncbi:MAG: hypothetical protein HXS41_12235 [Theionarchaea archaeon]|nr:hypothetical protein [Theionarchaea archaeon]MBU7021820.1 hypothetical protein [Theionarchaea archaeon]MBU7034151.1 hypothetical protein [Theionarchaea archaeon]MBU7040013.1 hypothetical protein [Theionarchaea archaeon]
MKISTKSLKGTEYSCIILGCNPFIGWSYRGRARAQEYKKKFTRPEPIKDIIVHAYQYGINALMTTADEHVLQAVASAQKEVGEIAVLGMLGYSIEGYRNFKEDIRKFSNVPASAAVIVAEITDPLIQKTPMLFDAYLDQVSREFDTVGAATHNPALSFSYLETTELDFLVAAANPAGFMMGKKDESLKLLKASQKPLIAKKILAGGVVEPLKGVEYAFCEVKADFAVVGVASTEEVDQNVEAYVTVSTRAT